MEYFYYEEITIQTRYWETSIKLMREHHSDSDIQMDQRRLKHSSFTASLNIERGQRMRARAWDGWGKSLPIRLTEFTFKDWRDKIFLLCTFEVTFIQFLMPVKIVSKYVVSLNFE